VLKERDGRRNRYEVQGHLPLPDQGHLPLLDPVTRSVTVGEVVAVLMGESGALPAAQRKSPVVP
jgi:hypothetical protein